MGAIAGFYVWGWEPSDSGVVRDAGLGYNLPVNIVDRRSHTHVGLVGTVLILVALFASLLFGVFFLWNVRPVLADNTPAPVILWAALAIVAGVVLWAAGALGRLLALTDRRSGAAFANLLTIAASSGGVGLVTLAIQPLDPYATAFAATIWAVGGFIAAVATAVILWALFNLARKLTGQVADGQALPDFNLATLCKAQALMLVATGTLLVVFAPMGAGHEAASASIRHRRSADGLGDTLRAGLRRNLGRLRAARAAGTEAGPARDRDPERDRPCPLPPAPSPA